MCIDEIVGIQELWNMDYGFTLYVIFGLWKGLGNIVWCDSNFCPSRALYIEYKNLKEFGKKKIQKDLDLKSNPILTRETKTDLI